MYSSLIIIEAVKFQDFVQRFSLEFNRNCSFQFVHMLTEFFYYYLLLLLLLIILSPTLGLSILSHSFFNVSILEVKPVFVVLEKKGQFSPLLTCFLFSFETDYPLYHGAQQQLKRTAKWTSPKPHLGCRFAAVLFPFTFPFATRRAARPPLA